MSYGNPGVTMLDQLQDVDDLERGQMMQMRQEHGGPDRRTETDKYIRSTHRPDPGSGMTQNIGLPGGGYGAPMYNSQYGTLQPAQQEMIAPPPAPTPEPTVFINCIDIVRHVQECPICSRFYRNDNTVYIIAIVVLSVVCLLLLKRVLNV